MPYIIRPRQARAVVVAVLGAVSLFAVAPALAGATTTAAAGCPAQASSTLLEKLGDGSNYYALPTASFEAGTTGWSLTSAAVVAEGDPFVGSHSLSLGGTSEAFSPKFCVSSETPTFRFFVRRAGGSSLGQLFVYLRWTDKLGLTLEVPAGLVLLGQNYGSSWTLTPVLSLAKAMVMLTGETTANVQIRFQSILGGTWDVDGVYIDPYSR